jgi:hypothetical protein
VTGEEQTVVLFDFDNAAMFDDFTRGKANIRCSVFTAANDFLPEGGWR